MGQIVIDIPSNKNRRYILTDVGDAEALLDSLDDTAVRLRNNPAKLTRQQIEDMQDGQRADRILRNSRRFYSQAEVEEMFGV